ncbi:MAG TPA: hypothetical protein DCR06_06460 [Planctomycetaceae bacterium]|nr:hypothetical protein [Planctomycetaceae bacterium]
MISYRIGNTRLDFLAKGNKPHYPYKAPTPCAYFTRLKGRYRSCLRSAEQWQGRYGKTLVYIFIGDQAINTMMARTGIAWWVRQGRIGYSRLIVIMFTLWWRSFTCLCASVVDVACTTVVVIFRFPSGFSKENLILYECNAAA